MRKQKINTLWRKVRPPREPDPLYYRNHRDPAGSLRAMMDPSVVVSEDDIRERFDLVPEVLDLTTMSMGEIANYIGQIGTPDAGQAQTINVEGNVTHTIQNGEVEFYRGTRRETR
jgi:hypothetical protein